MNIHLETITPDNWRIFKALKVKKEQERFVAENIGILAKAYVYRDYNSKVYGIYDGDLPIGMIMQRDYKENGKLMCELDQFMIAEKYQGKGYGRAAIQIWISIIKDEKKYDSICLCYVEGDEAARNLYLSMGFDHNGIVDEDEIVMEYNLRDSHSKL